MKNIWKTARLALALLLTLGLTCGAGLTAYAAETGSITLTLEDADENIVSDGALTLYQVATVSDNAYTYTSAFDGCTTALDVTDTGLAASLAAYVAQNGVTGAEGQISDEGVVTFSDLSQGLYLLVQTTPSTGFDEIAPVVVTVPILEDDVEVWAVDASPKVTVTAQTVETGGEDTPSEEILPPGDESTPEEDSPDESTTTEEEGTGTTTTSGGSGSSGGSASVTGSFGSASSTTLPQTGQLNWPIPLLAGGGLVLFAAGWFLMRRSDRDKRENAS